MNKSRTNFQPVRRPLAPGTRAGRGAQAFTGSQRAACASPAPRQYWPWRVGLGPAAYGPSRRPAGEHFAMAVYRLFKNKAFEPEIIASMTAAYAEVCRTLGVSDRDRPQADAVAKKVIEFAQRGERDPARLREHVLEAMRT